METFTPDDKGVFTVPYSQQDKLKNQFITRLEESGLKTDTGNWSKKGLGDWKSTVNFTDDQGNYMHSGFFKSGNDGNWKFNNVLTQKSSELKRTNNKWYKNLDSFKEVNKARTNFKNTAKEGAKYGLQFYEEHDTSLEFYKRFGADSIGSDDIGNVIFRELDWLKTDKDLAEQFSKQMGSGDIYKAPWAFKVQQSDLGQHADKLWAVNASDFNNFDPFSKGIALSQGEFAKFKQFIKTPQSKDFLDQLEKSYHKKANGVTNGIKNGVNGVNGVNGKNGLEELYKKWRYLFSERVVDTGQSLLEMKAEWLSKIPLKSKAMDILKANKNLARLVLPSGVLGGASILLSDIDARAEEYENNPTLLNKIQHKLSEAELRADQAGLVPGPQSLVTEPTGVAANLLNQGIDVVKNSENLYRAYETGAKYGYVGNPFF